MFWRLRRRYVDFPMPVTNGEHFDAKAVRAWIKHHGWSKCDEAAKLSRRRKPPRPASADLPAQQPPPATSSAATLSDQPSNGWSAYGVRRRA
jgi:hypothetical protein